MSENENSDLAKQAKAAFDRTGAVFNSVLDDGDSSEEQIKTAELAMQNSQVAYGKAVLAKLDERTRFLRTLVQALEGVISSIAINPVGNILDQANDVLTSVNSILGGKESG